MSMGYPTVQGYGGSPTAPTQSSSPPTLANAAYIGGIALQGIGNFMGSQAQAAQYGSGKRAIAMQIRQVRSQGRFQKYQMAVQLRRIIGAQVAGFASGGVEVTGTARQIIKQTYKTLSEDRERLSANIEAQIKGLHAAYKDARKAERAAKRSGVLGAVGTGLSAVTAGALLFCDARIKRDIRPVTNALAKIRRLAAYEYHYVGSDRQCIGLLAQEVEKQLPDAVAEVGGIKAINLHRIQALIIEGIKELENAGSVCTPAS